MSRLENEVKAKKLELEQAYKTIAETKFRLAAQNIRLNLPKNPEHYERVDGNH